MDCANTKEIGTGESSPPLEEARRPSEIRIRGLEGRLERTGSQVEIGEGGEVKVIKLMPTTKENMTKLMGMNNLKNKINGIAAEVLPEGVLNQEKFVSFKDASEQESEAKNLTELYAEAGKGRKRAEEKIKDDYEGNFKCMLDLVRCSVIVETEEQLGGVLGKMLELGIVVRLKNRFANPLPTGIRDCLMNVKINGHICEVQLHLSFIIKEKGAMHEYYNFFRDKFSGASASYTDIMGKVEALGLEGGKDNVEYGVSKLLKEGDLGKLRGLGDIMGKKEGFGDEALEVVVRRRIVEVIEGGGGEEGEAGKLELMDAYKELGWSCSWVEEWDDVMKYYELAKEGYEELQGAESENALGMVSKLISAAGLPGERIKMLQVLVKRMEKALGEENALTLETLNDLAVELKQTGQFEEAKEVHEKCLAGRLATYGEQHKGTLISLNNLGMVYQHGLKNNEKALECYERNLKGNEKLMGKNHPLTLVTVMNIAVIYAMKGDLQEAEVYFRKALEGNVAQLGKEHAHSKKMAKNFAQCLKLAGDIKGLEELKTEYPWLYLIELF